MSKRTLALSSGQQVQIITAEGSLQKHIIAGLIVSDEFIRKITPYWRDELLVEMPETARIARWCFDFFAAYGRPYGNMEQIFLRALKDEGIPKDEAKLIEHMLTSVSAEYMRDGGATINAKYLFDETVRYLCERRLTIGMENAEFLVERGKVAEAITALTEAAADTIEIAPIAEPSRARIAGWRIATAGAPTERLSDPWDDPEPPSFDLTMLPPVLRQFVEARSVMIGVGTNAMAWSTVAACGAALDASIRLQLKVTDFTFTVPPGIWLLLVGPPSSRKSPTLKAPFAPLHRIQAERITAWVRARAQWMAEDPKERGPEPTFVQLLTNSQTQEGIRDVLVGQDRGITIFADEWASHIGAMGRYSAGRDAASADRGFFNIAFDGGPFAANRANRKGGDRIAIANLQVTIIGSVQPDVLRRFNRNGELLGDGLLQRSCPILMGQAMLDREVEAAAVIKQYDALIQRLVAVPGGRVLRLSAEAEAIRRRLAPQFMALEQNAALGTGFATAAGKLHGIWGRLALTLEHVVSAGRDELPQVVGERAAERAERLVMDSLIPNLTAFYQTLGAGSDVETTQAIAAFLLRQQRVRVTASDIVRSGHAIANRKTDQVRDALSPLVAMGWLTPEGDDERRARAWEVNQAIYVQFAERAAKVRADGVTARELLSRQFGRADMHLNEENTLTREMFNSGDEPPPATILPQKVADVACARESNYQKPTFFKNLKESTHARKQLQQPRFSFRGKVAFHATRLRMSRPLDDQ